MIAPSIAAMSGVMLATCGRDGELKLWHLATKRELATILTLPVGVNFAHVAFSPDGAWLGASDTSGKLHLFHAPRASDLDQSANPRL